MEAREVIKKLFKKKSAILGVGTILVASFLALFASIIIPDKTKDANEQIASLALKDPGYKVQTLKIRRNIDFPKRGFVKKLISGTHSKFEFLPYSTIELNKDQILLEDLEGKTKYLKPWNIVFPVSKILNEGVNDIELELSNKEKIKISKEEILASLEKDNIVSKRFFFGTDRYGRDIFSRIILGLRV